jgi:hypothetical protein
MKHILFAIRELMLQTAPDETSQDLVAFIGLSLLDIYSSIENSVEAWEKKGYWLKADRFRLEWEWTRQVGDELCKAVLNQDWGTIAIKSALVAQKFSSTKLPKTNKSGPIWTGYRHKLAK